MLNGIKKVGAREVLIFDDINPAGLKKVMAMFEKNGLKVINLEANNRKINRNGMKTKKAHFIIAGGQSVELRVNDTGDIYQVAINGKVSPFREHKKISDLVKDIAKAVNKNQEAFDKSTLKRVAAATRKQSRQDSTSQPVTAAAQLELVVDRLTELQNKVAQLNVLVAGLNQEITDLNTQITDKTAKSKENKTLIGTLRSEIDSLLKQVVEA